MVNFRGHGFSLNAAGLSAALAISQENAIPKIKSDVLIVLVVKYFGYRKLK